MRGSPKGTLIGVYGESIPESNKEDGATYTEEEILDLGWVYGNAAQEMFLMPYKEFKQYDYRKVKICFGYFTSYAHIITRRNVFLWGAARYGDLIRYADAVRFHRQRVTDIKNKNYLLYLMKSGNDPVKFGGLLPSCLPVKKRRGLTDLDFFADIAIASIHFNY